MTYDLPQQLVEMASDSRLIPFVGAGVSTSVGLPSWRGMLEQVCTVAEDGPAFTELAERCSGDFLQIAEYLYLVSGAHIGPLRQKIADIFRTSDICVEESASHVELFNLGASQVYTTNYDDLIEKTYRALGVKCDVVALPRDLALGGASNRPQVVKYHGDLRYEDTLVLTESSYYDRLDLESPMDLKFRSDLLGRSVLFLGYSFRDINIRVIWHKLMRVMRDVPEHDRPLSWIIRFEEDPVQELLNRAAGIHTIVLGPTRENLDYGDRLAAFLLDLSVTAGRYGEPSGRKYPQVVSKAVLSRLDGILGAPGSRRRAGLVSDDNLLMALATRRLPNALSEHFNALMAKASMAPVSEDITFYFAEAALNNTIGGIFGPGVSAMIYRALRYQYTRESVVESLEGYEAAQVEFPWSRLYEQPVAPYFAVSMIRALESEVGIHSESNDYQPDVDILFTMDLVERIVSGELKVAGQIPDEELQRAKELVAEARGKYALLKKYRVLPGKGPSFADAAKLDEILPRRADETSLWPEVLPPGV